jgi:hypothetical protein
MQCICIFPLKAEEEYHKYISLLLDASFVELEQSNSGSQTADNRNQTCAKLNSCNDKFNLKLSVRLVDHHRDKDKFEVDFCNLEVPIDFNN